MLHFSSSTSVSFYSVKLEFFLPSARPTRPQHDKPCAPTLCPFHSPLPFFATIKNSKRRTARRSVRFSFGAEMAGGRDGAGSALSTFDRDVRPPARSLALLCLYRTVQCSALRINARGACGPPALLSEHCTAAQVKSSLTLTRAYR